jgi:hypothetical protein
MAATQSVAELARSVSGVERLRSILVTQKMRPVGQIEFEVLPPGQEDSVVLADLLKRFDKERVLFVGTKASPIVRYLIYRANINEYLSLLGRDSTKLPAGKTLAQVTLKDLLESNASQAAFFTSCFGFVSETATLADAKLVLDNIPKCGDVFVTKSGNRSEPILGWITDNTIAENARV